MAFTTEFHSALDLNRDSHEHSEYCLLFYRRKKQPDDFYGDCWDLTNNQRSNFEFGFLSFKQWTRMSSFKAPRPQTAPGVRDSKH